MIKDEKRVNELYEQAKATMELEGFVYTEEDEKVIKEVISGRKPFHELIRELKKVWFCMQSKYCYPNSDVLINKLNIRDEKELEIAERRITTVKIAQLYEKPITGKFDMKHWQAIHKHIFQDIYPFAGKLRDEQIAKGYFQFAIPLYFTDMFKDLHNQLKKEKFLNGMDKENISKRLAYYMAEINVIHPFREGNGRSTREYIRFLAMSNGYTLDWSKIDRNELLNASVRSTINTDKLEQLIYNSIKENEPSKEIMRKWKNAELEDGLEL